MFFQGTESVTAWVFYAIFFVTGAVLFGGIVAIAAVKQLRKITSERDDDNPRWQFTDVQSILAFVIVFSFIGVVAAFIFKPPSVDAAAKDTLILLVGALVAKFGDVCAYFFNSSVQSKAKDETARLTAVAATKAADATSTAANTMAAFVAGTGSGQAGGTSTLTTATSTETIKPPDKPTDPVVKETTTETVTTPTK